MKGVHNKSYTSSFQTQLYQIIGLESSSSNDADNFENHLKKLQFRKQKIRKVDLSTTETLIDMIPTKFKEDFSKVSE